MTREEREKAIDALKISAPVMAVTQEEFNDYIQTLNKIMDWLEQEPCTDAISRQAAIDALDCINGVEEVLRALPPVTPQYTEAEIQKMQDLEFAEIQKAYEIGKAENPNKWIPVSERLPEIHQDVILSLRSLDIGVGFRAKTEPCFYCRGVDSCYIDPKNVLAWMPLPEPYKAESEDKE